MVCTHILIFTQRRHDICFIRLTPDDKNRIHVFLQFCSQTAAYPDNSRIRWIPGRICHVHNNRQCLRCILKQLFVRRYLLYFTSQHLLKYFITFPGTVFPCKILPETCKCRFFDPWFQIPVFYRHNRFFHHFIQVIAQIPWMNNHFRMCPKVKYKYRLFIILHLRQRQIKSFP